MTKPTFAHYRMQEGCDIECLPATTDGNCRPYFVEEGGQYKLCVIEGGAFHNFDISLMGLARLADEATSLLRSRLERTP